MIHICRPALCIGKHFENQIAAIIKDKHFRKNLWCPGFNEKIDVPSLYSKLIFDLKMMCINFLNIIKIEKSIFVKINIYFSGTQFGTVAMLLLYQIGSCLDLWLPLAFLRIEFKKKQHTYIFERNIQKSYTCYSRIVSINRKLWQGL